MQRYMLNISTFSRESFGCFTSSNILLTLQCKSNVVFPTSAFKHIQRNGATIWRICLIRYCICHSSIRLLIWSDSQQPVILAVTASLALVTKDAFQDLQRSLEIDICSVQSVEKQNCLTKCGFTCECVPEVSTGCTEMFTVMARHRLGNFDLNQSEKNKFFISKYDIIWLLKWRWITVDKTLQLRM